MSATDYPKQVNEAMERDLGVTINRGNRRADSDTRFCYGANCTWYGSIHEVSNTHKHPRWSRESKKDDHGLPCCPVCGGMLFEMPNESEWWKGIDQFESGDYPGPKSHPHPGYRAMWEWQRKQKQCFGGRNGITQLVFAYRQATGIDVDVEP